jgi:hypothetical protein
MPKPEGRAPEPAKANTTKTVGHAFTFLGKASLWSVRGILAATEQHEQPCRVCLLIPTPGTPKNRHALEFETPFAGL